MRWVQLGVFLLGSALAGLAGALIAPLVSVDNELAPSYVLLSFAVVIVGGMGSLTGAFAASVAIGLTESAFVSYLPQLAGFSLYFAILIILLARPQGLRGRVAADTKVH